MFADSRGSSKDNNRGIEISLPTARAIGLKSGDQAHAVFIGNFRTGFPIDDAIQKGAKKAGEINSAVEHTAPPQRLWDKTGR